MSAPAPPPWYCVECGVRLLGEHSYCWNCGALRWQPGEAARVEPAASPTAPAAPAAPPLASLKLFFAFWAVVLLAWATVDLAVLAAPDAGNPVPVPAQVLVIVIKLVIAALHGGAYYGIRARRVRGWLLAVVLAGLWSLLLIGIPALVMLLRRSTREAFGLA